MLLIPTVVKKSPIHGRGLFADQDVAEGQVVWEFDEKVDLSFPKKYLDYLPEHVQRYAATYGSIEDGVFYFDGDDTRYMNHSAEPNVKTGPGHDSMYAVRPIKKGEELLCDYREFDDPSRNGDEPYV